MADIDVEHLSRLARIESPKGEERKRIEDDLKRIVAYFSELEGCDSEGVKPQGGNSEKVNGYRNDEDSFKDETQKEEEREASLKQFPDRQNTSLKTPPVFGE